MQYMFEQENIFYEEKCNTTEIRDRCISNCDEPTDDISIESKVKVNQVKSNLSLQRVSKIVKNPTFVRKQKVTTIQFLLFLRTGISSSKLL